jgi:hypothetical protein
LKNKSRLKYDEALAAGFPVASGVIEGACRHLINDRLDITGARWGLQGAESILKLRSLKSSGDLVITGNSINSNQSCGFTTRFIVKPIINKFRRSKGTTPKEIESLVEQADRCDKEEDQAYKDKNGDELRDDVKFKSERLAQIKEAKEALEKREGSINPGKTIEDKKQISFADKDARIMGKKGSFDDNYNPQISVDADNPIIVGQHVSQNANDKQEVGPALKAVIEATGRSPDKESMDNGYMSGDN